MNKLFIACLSLLCSTTVLAEQVEHWEGRWTKAKLQNKKMQCNGVRQFKTQAVVMRGHEGAIYPMSDENYKGYVFCLEKSNKNKALWLIFYNEGKEQDYLGENCTATGKKDISKAWSCAKKTPLKKDVFSYEEDKSSVIWNQ